MGARLKFRCEGLQFPPKKTWKKVAKRPPHQKFGKGGGEPK